jgi:hypothetical protein
MANLIKEARFIKCNKANNNNKFWYIELYDDASIVTKNGRVDSKPQVHLLLTSLLSKLNRVHLRLQS